MRLAIWKKRKTLATIFTLKRFHSRMNSLVWLAICRRCKAFFTILAFIRFFARVSSFTDPELEGLDEAFITILALMRFPICVNSFMDLALWWLMKLSLQSLHLKLFFPLLPFVAFVSMSDCVGCITVWAWCCIMFPWVPLYDIEIKIVNLGRRANIFEISLYHICFFIRC